MQYRSWDMSYSEEHGFLVLSMQLLTQSGQHLPRAGEERGRVLR